MEGRIILLLRVATLGRRSCTKESTWTAAAGSVEAIPATLAMMCGNRVVITGAEFNTSCPRPLERSRACASRCPTLRTTLTVMERADWRENVFAKLAVLAVMFGSSELGLEW